MTHLRFNGDRNPTFRAFVETLPTQPIAEATGLFKAYRKTAMTYAARVFVPFTVETLEGPMSGKAGDYLAVGPAGEMYPIAADVFAASYEGVE